MQIFLNFTFVFSRVCLLPAPQHLGPDLVEVLHEGVVDHEGDGNVQADPAHPRHCSLVERLRSLVHQDLSKQVIILLG